jgi:gliding motility-associated protein GldC
MDQVVKQADITITVGLNRENVPVSIRWSAADAPDAQKPQPCKAMLLSLFNGDSLETLKIDLWTQDMQVIEMDRFFFQTLRALADTYYKATQNAPLAADMHRFVQYFGEKTEILPHETSNL